MAEHLVDTEIKLGQCNRCDAYVFMAMASGVRSAADPAPVDRNGYIAALTEGRRLFRLVERSGRPYKLLTRRPADLEPSFDEKGAQTGAQRLLAEHGGCGGRQRNMITFRELEQAPPQTVCEQWQATGWTPPPGKCGRARSPQLKGCPTCSPPPF
jgi:hypothetical protein